MSGRACKDCLDETFGNSARVKLRPAPYPGPRCATHHRVAALYRKKRAQEKRRLDTYGLTPDDHTALLALQGGACAICQRAKGTTRALAVDHDHACCNGPTSCGRCVRGLLCKPCNRMLGHLRDDPKAFLRAEEYLTVPPMQLLRNRRTARARSASAASDSRSAAAGSSARGATATGSSGPGT